MNKREKAAEIDALAGALKAGPTAFVLGPKGLTVNQVTMLRRRVRASAGQFRVVKNRLALRALKETPLAPLFPHFKGETAIAYGAADPAPLARAIEEFARDNQGLTIKGGMVDGRLVAPRDIKAIADMPPRPVLIARLLGALKQPMTRLVTVLKGPHRSVVRVLDEIARTRKGDGAPPAAPEASAS